MTVFELKLLELRNQIDTADRLAFAELKWLYTDVHLLRHEDRLSELGQQLEYFSKKYGTIFIRDFEKAMQEHFADR